MRTLGRILKLFVVLAVFGLLGLTVYATLFDLPPPKRENVIALPLPADG